MIRRLFILTLFPVLLFAQRGEETKTLPTPATKGQAGKFLRLATSERALEWATAGGSTDTTILATKFYVNTANLRRSVPAYTGSTANFLRADSSWQSISADSARAAFIADTAKAAFIPDIYLKTGGAGAGSYMVGDLVFDVSSAIYGATYISADSVHTRALAIDGPISGILATNGPPNTPVGYSIKFDGTDLWTMGTVYSDSNFVLYNRTNNFQTIRVEPSGSTTIFSWTGLVLYGNIGGGSIPTLFTDSVQIGYNRGLFVEGSIKANHLVSGDSAYFRAYGNLPVTDSSKSAYWATGLRVPPDSSRASYYATSLRVMPDSSRASYWSSAVRGNFIDTSRASYYATTLRTPQDSARASYWSSNVRGNYLKPADSTTLKNALLKNADSTTLKNALLKNADSTTLKNALLKNADSTSLRNYSTALYAPKASPTFTGRWTGSASIRGTATFSGTGTRVAVFVSGTATGDIVVCTPALATVVTTTNLTAFAKTDSLIFNRGASGTSGAVLNWILMR